MSDETAVPTAVQPTTNSRKSRRQLWLLLLLLVGAGAALVVALFGFRVAA